MTTSPSKKYEEYVWLLLGVLLCVAFATMKFLIAVYVSKGKLDRF